MSFNASALCEVQTGGSDTQGGFFDPALATSVSNFAATSATGNSPVVSSASYTFVAGDVGSWVFIKSGTNWIPGWYKITAVVGGSATVNAASGQVILYGGTTWFNTTAGIASTASPTSGTGSVDYSQQSSAQATGTVTSSTTTVTATTSIFSPVMVGNAITDGTTWKFITAYTSATVVTVDSSPSWTAATIKVGGALGSPGKAGGLKVAGNSVWMQTGTYTLSTSSANASGGPVSDTTGGTDAAHVTRWEGYGTLRGDKGTKPIIAVPGAGTYSNAVIFSCSSANYIILDNFTCDGGGNASTGMTGFAVGNSYQHAVRCKADRVAKGINIVNLGNDFYIQNCEATRCTTYGIADNGSSTKIIDCISHGNTGSADGFQCNNATTCIRCISYSNGGNGFNQSSVGCYYVNTVAYGNTSDGFFFQSVQGDICENCISYGNIGIGFNTSAGAAQLLYLKNCAGGGNSSNYSTANVYPLNVESFVTLTGNPFTNPAAGDFSLNNTAGAGAACRGAAFSL